MKLRRILTVLNGDKADGPMLSQSIRLASETAAKLDGLFVRRNAASGGDFLGDAFSTYGMEAVLEALDDAAARASQAAHKAFDVMADEAEADHTGRYIEYVGLPRSAMAREGRLADLVVMEKPSQKDLRNQLNAIETAAFESGRPVLVLPRDRAPDQGFSKIAIAWDGSLEATRAVTGAMPFLEEAEAVSLLHAGTDADASDQLADLAAYLAAHGVTAATRTVPLDGRSVARALIETTTSDGADLLVMGGFGAPGWQRSLGRDETTALIKKVPFAILLAH